MCVSEKTGGVQCSLHLLAESKRQSRSFECTLPKSRAFVRNRSDINGSDPLKCETVCVSASSTLRQYGLESRNSSAARDARNALALPDGARDILLLYDIRQA